MMIRTTLGMTASILAMLSATVVSAQSLAELEAAAKAEGMLTTIALPIASALLYLHTEQHLAVTNLTARSIGFCAQTGTVQLLGFDQAVRVPGGSDASVASLLFSQDVRDMGRLLFQIATLQVTTPSSSSLQPCKKKKKKKKIPCKITQRLIDDCCNDWVDGRPTMSRVWLTLHGLCHPTVTTTTSFQKKKQKAYEQSQLSMTCTTIATSTTSTTTTSSPPVATKKLRTTPRGSSSRGWRSLLWWQSSSSSSRVNDKDTSKSASSAGNRRIPSPLVGLSSKSVVTVDTCVECNSVVASS